jgi:hypothetical protein
MESVMSAAWSSRDPSRDGVGQSGNSTEDPDGTAAEDDERLLAARGWLMDHEEMEEKQRLLQRERDRQRNRVEELYELHRVYAKATKKTFRALRGMPEPSFDAPACCYEEDLDAEEAGDGEAAVLPSSSSYGDADPYCSHPREQHHHQDGRRHHRRRRYHQPFPKGEPQQAHRFTDEGEDAEEEEEATAGLLNDMVLAAVSPASASATEGGRGPHEYRLHHAAHPHSTLGVACAEQQHVDYLNEESVREASVGAGGKGFVYRMRNMDVIDEEGEEVEDADDGGEG